MVWYSAAIPTAGFGLIGGSEISLLILAAATQYKWRTAWLMALAGIATFIPILTILYFFFISLPDTLTELVAGSIIFLLGLNFLYKGIRKRGKHEAEEEDKVGLGLFGIYTAIVFEEVELSTITMSIGAVGGSYLPAILGLMAGLAVPLATIRFLKPLLERAPEWLLKTLVGLIMMAVASAILVLHI